MKFPLSISKRIIIQQPEQKITLERYLLNQIESKLEVLDMSMSRINDNKLFLQKTDFLRAMRKKDFLRNLSVQIKIDNSTIQIILTTETILILIFGLLPYGILLVPNQNIPFTLPIIVSTFFLGVGFISKLLIMQDIKNEIEHHIKRMNSL